MTKAELNAEALRRAQSCRSLGNIVTVIREFTARGIPEADIVPGENVLTFRAWLAKGRCVRKGEHGVKVATLREITKATDELDPRTGERKVSTFRRPWAATVFHVSQTDPVA